jgi:coenzyme Q-binding protein COQ10
MLLVSDEKVDAIMPERIEWRHLPYTPSQLFDLVADVGRYPDFVPWIVAARVRRRTERKIWTEMTAGTGFLRRRFSTVAVLDRPHRIAVSSHDAIFERFEQQWTFEAAPAGGTDIVYRVDLKFRSVLARTLLGPSFSGRARVIVAAFVHRARVLYGRPARRRLRRARRAPVSRVARRRAD